MCPIYPVAWPPAESRAEVVSLIREAIESHRELMREEGLSIPEPSSTAESVEVEAA